MKKWIAVFISLLLYFPVQSQTKVEKIDDLLQRYYDYNLFNGTVLIADSGEVIYENAFGYANLEWKVPMTVDTKFRIGSISKQFTATIIMQLVEEGKIKLNDKLTDYLPDYRKDTGDKITIHHLLTHTSGIVSYTNLPNVWIDSLKNSYEKNYFIKHFHSSDLEFEPGTKYNYNNTGYYLLAAIIEEVTGKHFGDVLRERIIEPAGMKNTGSEDDDIIVEKMASGYLRSLDTYREDRYMYMPNAMGAGHMHSIVRDLYKWDQALYTEKILSKESKEKMFTPFLNNYGCGWVIRKFAAPGSSDSSIVIMHGGGINGFNTLFARDTSTRSTLIIFSNIASPPLNEMMTNISRILSGMDIEYPKRPIADAMKEVIDDEGIEAGIDYYRELKNSEDAVVFDFSEPQLNILGYTYLRNDQIDYAVELFKLNIEVFPDAYNTYDSMGESYMVNGDKELAIENYKKSLELNPGNTNAINKLKELGVEQKENEAKVTNEILSRYVGEYELMPNFIITITVEGNKIFAQATGQGKFEIFPNSQTSFYYKVVNAQIDFVENAEGEFDQLILHQNGRDMPAKKIK